MTVMSYPPMPYGSARPIGRPRAGLWCGLAALGIDILAPIIGQGFGLGTGLLVLLAVIVGFAGIARDNQAVLVNQVVSGVAIAIALIISGASAVVFVQTVA